MWRFLHGCFTKLQYALLSLEPATTTSKHRDELSSQIRQPACRNDEHDQLQQPLLDHPVVPPTTTAVDHDHTRDFSNTKLLRVNSTRIKLRMTKREAEPLLSRFRKQKGTLKLNEFAEEIANIPIHGIAVISGNPVRLQQSL